MRLLLVLAFCHFSLVAGIVFRPARGAFLDAVPPPAGSLEQRFSARVQPFLERYCHSCHAGKKPKASLDLSRDSTVKAVAANMGQWEMVLQRLQAQEMPPEDAPRRPAAEERAAVIAWLQELREQEARR